MPITITESLPLGRFVFDRSWTPVLGAYIYPLRYFGDRAGGMMFDPNNYLEVVKVLDCGDRDVVITRGGGLFARMRLQRSNDEVNRLEGLFNMVLCEFALEGLVSQPITDTDVQMGKLIGRHAAIAGGFGDYGERTWGPLALLASDKRDLGQAYNQSGNDWLPVNFYWTCAVPDMLDRITGVGRAVSLATYGDAIPSLLVAAVSHAARHNFAETIVSSWIICEAILSKRWNEYIATIADNAQRQRLKDHRTYTASVQAEFLLVAGLLPHDVYQLIQTARKIRNDLAHGAALSPKGAQLTYRALAAAVGWTGIDVRNLPQMVFSSGGVGGPTIALEPSFQFR